MDRGPKARTENLVEPLVKNHPEIRIRTDAAQTLQTLKGTA